MNAKRRRFVEEYLVDLNATQAAIRAGYSAKTAKSTGQRLLTFDDVREAIKNAQAERSKRTELTMDYVIDGLQEVAERCLQRKPVLNMKGEQVQDDEGRDVWRFDSQGANRAFELIGKHLGGFVEKRHVDMNATINVFDDEQRRQLLELGQDD